MEWVRNNRNNKGKMRSKTMCARQLDYMMSGINALASKDKHFNTSGQGHFRFQLESFCLWSDGRNFGMMIQSTRGIDNICREQRIQLKTCFRREEPVPLTSCSLWGDNIVLIYGHSAAFQGIFTLSSIRRCDRCPVTRILLTISIT